MNLCKSKRCYNGCVPLQTRAAALATVAYTNSESTKKKKRKKKSSGWLQQLQYLPAEQAQYETEGVQI